MLYFSYYFHCPVLPPTPDEISKDREIASIILKAMTVVMKIEYSVCMLCYHFAISLAIVAHLYTIEPPTTHVQTSTTIVNEYNIRRFVFFFGLLYIYIL